ncbi:MAG: hypothetical protein ACOX3I_04415 [Limnochordia bacterium]|jgi:hypothetical protein
MCSHLITLDKNAVEIFQDVQLTIVWPEGSTAVKITALDGEGNRYCSFALARVPAQAASTSVVLHPEGALGEHTIAACFDTQAEAKLSFELECQMSIKTDTQEFDGFYERIKWFMSHDTLSIQIDDKEVYGYRSPDSPMIWIRDHTHQMKGFRYFEEDVVSAVEFFLDNQMPDGSIYDFVAKDGSCTRVEVEADVEYLVVEAAFRVWQITGDLAWVEKYLPNLDAALTYSMTSPIRWSQEHGLIKRPFTIDTWDFAYTGGKERSRGRIRENEPFGIMHGDNTGFAQSANMLAALYERCGNLEKAHHWRTVSRQVVENLNKYCWNGKFYTHHVHIDPVDVEGVDEARQLSLSNAYGMNRGVVDHGKCVSIINEYLERRKTTAAFAEWFSIDPPFPENAFGFEKLVPGAYVNGGIMPLVGGELARAAFDHGFEEYGADILRRYKDMIEESNETYLWYFPSGQPSAEETSTSPEALPTDGWGSSAMLYAFVEGLCGVVDLAERMQRVKIAPRWDAAGVKRAEVKVRYGAVPVYTAYRWEHNPEEHQYTIQFASQAREVELQLLLPENRSVADVYYNGQLLESDAYEIASVEDSVYLKLSICAGNGTVQFNYR